MNIPSTLPISELSFETLFNVVNDAMLLLDESGNIVLANSASQIVFGHSKEEICKLKVESLVPDYQHGCCPLYPNIYKNNPEKLGIDNGRVQVITLKNNGLEQRMDIRLIPLKTDERLYTLAIFYAADYNQSAEQKLIDSDERLRLAKQAAQLAIFDFDSNHNILHWDEDMSLLWGAESIESVSKKRFKTVIHPDDRKSRQAALERAINPANNGEYNTEYRVINPLDGSHLWVSAVGRMHFEDGRAMRLVGVARNITQQKLFEKKLQEQRSEAETVFKQQVAAQTISAIAHEINQPLTAISAYSEVALKAMKAQDIDIDKLTRALKGCVHQAERAGNNLHELLSFLHKYELVKAPFDINETVKEALNVANDDGYGGFHPELQLEKRMPHVIGNKIQVQKVIVNLIRNAVEAMHGAGIASSKIVITVETNKHTNMAHILVKDNGPGLNAIAQKHVFEPFFTTKSTGIGMGLSISRALIEANGGELWYEPNAVKGAIFHFTLPLVT